MSHLKRKIKVIDDIIDTLLKTRDTLVDLCPHEERKEEHKGNTGNYDPSQNCYWVEYECLNCGKIWSEDK